MLDHLRIAVTAPALTGTQGPCRRLSDYFVSAIPSDLRNVCHDLSGFTVMDGFKKKVKVCFNGIHTTNKGVHKFGNITKNMVQ